MKTESGFVQSGKARLYYEAAGEGTAIVFLHAGIADGRQWNHEFSHLAADYRVVRYDRRGFGKSEPVEGEFRHLEDLVAALDGLGLTEPVVLAGCSMGGGLALDFALAYPERVKALVLVGAGPSGLMLDVELHPLEADLEAAYEAGDLERVAELATEIFVDGMGRTAAQVDPAVRELALRMNRLVLAHEAKELGKALPNAETPAAGRLGELGKPALVIVGEHDEPYSLAAADYMAAEMPAARKVVLAEAAHLANMDRPAAFEAALRAFLEAV